jgi:light-regulated signal transduction histidine kinase (bacteriophytochrome)
MLLLSRVTRHELKTTRVDLTELGGTIAKALNTANPERTVQLVVQPNLSCSADPTLVRTLLENLLGNAWKFTGKLEAARVELGSETRNKERVYYVRDNGAGFDPTYADKLFKAFQRLHHQNDFAGTGIGLATVHRIVSRHGGRVWAESAVGQGATFYFTLPKPQQTQETTE